MRKAKPRGGALRKSPSLKLATVALISAIAVGCHGTRTKPPGQTTLTSSEMHLAMPPVMPGIPDVATLASKVSPCVVNVTVTEELRVPNELLDPFEFSLGRGRSRGRGHEDIIRRRGLGSGFILDAEGHIATNAHVVENATTVRVKLADDRELDAEVKGRDELLDLAVLELHGEKDLPYAVLGRSEDLRVGEYVVAVGNPFGLGNTVTMGIVSAKGRELGTGPYDDFIQTDASINPGSSGGPLFNLRGEVVGISTAINPAGRGIGFAIPIDEWKDVLPKLVAGETLSRGRLGVVVQSMDASLARAIGLDRPRGALVSEVEPGSAADNAGIKSGEVILEISKVPVTRAHALPRLIARRAPGAHVSLTVVGSHGATRTVDATLDGLHEDGGAATTRAAPSPGARGEIGLELGDDGHGGVVVRGLDPGSIADEALEPGDTILEVNGARVTSAADASSRVQKTDTEKPLLLKMKRGENTLFVALERR
jgi:serine protease Do